MAPQKADIIVENGVVVSGDGLARKQVVIQDGLVRDTPEDASAYTAGRVIDARGKFVLPGIVDAHFHPVYADRIDTLSRAAAAGGITTLIPYVGAVAAWGQGGDLVDAIASFRDEGEATSILDFGIHCTLIQTDMARVDAAIPALVRMGVVSFKGFTAYKKRGMMLEDEQLLAIMGLIAENRGLFAAHCENGPILDHLEAAARARGDAKPEHYPPTHPGIAEAEAVFRVLTLARVAGCPMYLPHLSAHESLEVVRLFRAWGGQTIFTETCPHYLTLTDEALKHRGSLAKMSPPLRGPRDVEALWAAVENGLVDVVASDAAGHMTSANEPLFDDIFSAPHGIPGLDTMFTVTYDAGVNTGRISLPRLVRMTAENPARIFGLYPRKGVLEKGADADLVIFDPSIPWVVPAKNPYTAVDYSLYEGRRCLGAPTLVMQRGAIVMEDGQIRADPGQGRFLAGRLDHG